MADHSPKIGLPCWAKTLCVHFCSLRVLCLFLQQFLNKVNYDGDKSVPTHEWIGERDNFAQARKIVVQGG